jgi:hypothetical protein
LAARIGLAFAFYVFILKPFPITFRKEHRFEKPYFLKQQNKFKENKVQCRQYFLWLTQRGSLPL